MNIRSILVPIAALMAFAIPACIVLSNAGYFLGFADAAEFALVTRIGGIAHPPGFPAYVLTGKIWSMMMHLLGVSHIKAMVWFSVYCTATASTLVFLTMSRWLKKYYPEKSEISLTIVSLVSAVSFVTGITAWYWAGNVEVYAMQVLAFAITFYGLTAFQMDRKKHQLIISAFGISLGLANHHLTMVLVLPFLLLFFKPDLFEQIKVLKKDVTKNKKQKEETTSKTTFISQLIKSKDLRLLILYSFLMTSSFYCWMIFRAGIDLPFKFGNPDNFSRFLYHIAGGAWIENTGTTVKGLIALRFPYFMSITFGQIFLFMPFLILGFVELFRKKRYHLIYICLGYYLLILLYQLRIDQTSDTDAYMLPSFLLLTMIIPFGFMYVLSFNKLFIYLFPVLLITQVYLHFPKTDKRHFNINEALMQELDRSAPLNSTILIADWTTVIQYYYCRIADHFRPDLIVLNYDLKFTNYKILPAVYPEYYKEIKPEYDHFIELLGASHPQEIYNTGCSLDTPELLKAFDSVIVSHKKDIGFWITHKWGIFLCS